MTHRIALGLLCLLVLLLPTAARAAEKDGRVEVFGGVYKPEGLGSKGVFGARAGAQLTDRFGIEGSVGRFSIKDLGFKLDVTLADISFKVYLSDPGPARFFLFAGPGWAFVNLRGSSERADSLTGNVGGGVDVQIGDKLYLRPDVRGRWFQKGTNNKLEWEGTLALGLKF